MANLEIRPMLARDYEELVEIEHLIWNETNTPARIHWPSAEAYGRQKAGELQWVAVLDGKVAGYINAHHKTKFETNRHVYEIDMGVHPNAQRKGVGRALLKEIERVVRERGGRKLSLRVLETNSGAIAFYKSCGFQEEGRLVKEFIINGRPVDDILMSKFL